MTEREKPGPGCDLRDKCGFYCEFVHSKSELWQIMIRNYCEGQNYPLCARRIFFLRTGECAPFDLTPIGTLPEDLHKELLKKDRPG